MILLRFLRFFVMGSTALPFLSCLPSLTDPVAPLPLLPLTAPANTGTGSGGGTGSGAQRPSGPGSVMAAQSGDNEVGVTWAAVSGAVSYTVYYSTAAGVTTGTGTAVPSLATVASVTGLPHGVTYYFIVTSFDGTTESLPSTEVSVRPTCADPTSADGCWIFIDTGPTGGMGGTSGGDAHCLSGAAMGYVPGLQADYRALLMTEAAATPRRDLTHDWVLHPSTAYQAKDNGGNIVGTTDGLGQFPFPLANTIQSPGGAAVLTGIDASGISWQPKTGNTCNSWTSSSGGDIPGLGVSNRWGSDAFDNGAALDCSRALSIYCVRQ